MKKHALIAIVLSQTVLFGCTPAPDNSDPFSYAQPHWLDLPTPTIDDSESDAVRAKKMAMSGQVTCDSSNPADCSPSVGMLVALADSTSVSQCTAFLVSPQIAITNSHCIPDDLKASGSSCSNRMWFYFPDLSGFPKLRTGCAKVLSATTLPEKTEAVPDYAVVQLDQPVSRPVLQLSRDGFKNGDAFQLVKVDPQSKTAPIGAMTRITCTAVHNSVIVPNSDNDKSTNMALGDCEIMHGNSGSPILDSHGNVHGIIQLSFEKDSMKATIEKNNTPMLDGDFVAVAGGTNFACMNFPSDVGIVAMDTQCSTITAKADPKSASDAFYARIQRQLDLELKKTTDQMNPGFQWEFVKYKNDADSEQNNMTQYLIPVPTCIQDSKSLLDAERIQNSSKDQSLAILPILLPKLSLSIGLNRYLALDYRLGKAGGVINSNVVFDPKEIETGSSKIMMTENNEDGSVKSSLFSQKLDACSKPTTIAGGTAPSEPARIQN